MSRWLMRVGMGVILMLGIQYLVSLRNDDHRPPPGLEKQSRMGPILVTLSLAFNLLQMIFDLVRGWQVSNPPLSPLPNLPAVQV